VFDVPEGMRIEYSTAGVLAALSVLALRVVPLATPRPAGQHGIENEVHGERLGIGGRQPVGRQMDRASFTPSWRRTTCSAGHRPPPSAPLECTAG
jgi:hypothetical protein